MNKQILITAVIVLIIVIGGGYFLLQKPTDNQQPVNEENTTPIENENPTVKIETLQEGIGEGAKVGDIVSVHYVGTLEDGTQFDSSLDRQMPFSFTLGQGQVIDGWEMGILGMKLGEKRRLTIPSELGYGASGAGGVIPSNATLIFEVEMLDITSPGK